MTVEMVSTFELIQRIEKHVLALRRAPFSAALAGRANVVIAERALAAVVALEAAPEPYKQAPTNEGQRPSTDRAANSAQVGRGWTRNDYARDAEHPRYDD